MNEYDRVSEKPKLSLVLLIFSLPLHFSSPLLAGEEVVAAEPQRWPNLLTVWYQRQPWRRQDFKLWNSSGINVGRLSRPRSGNWWLGTPARNNQGPKALLSDILQEADLRAVHRDRDRGVVPQGLLSLISLAMTAPMIPLHGSVELSNILSTKRHRRTSESISRLTTYREMLRSGSNERSHARRSSAGPR